MGHVVISIDGELAWGYHDLEQPPDERVRNARAAWSSLVELLEKYSIPATWAVVGHLLLEECDGIHGDHPIATTGWFESDPGDDMDEINHWHGIDLVDAVRSSVVDHEIGCHSFSHVVFDRNRIDTDVATAEVRRCIEIAAERNLSLDSFVFPRNTVGFRETLASHGFTAYRGARPSRWYDDSSAYPIAKAVEFTVTSSPPPVVSPKIDEHGLVNIPASLYLFSFEQFERPFTFLCGEHPVVRQARLAIDAVADSDGVAHLWFHPNNLWHEPAFDRLEKVLSIIADHRNRGSVTIETMTETARRIHNHHDV